MVWKVHSVYEETTVHSRTNKSHLIHKILPLWEICFPNCLCWWHYPCRRWYNWNGKRIHVSLSFFSLVQIFYYYLLWFCFLKSILDSRKRIDCNLSIWTVFDRWIKHNSICHGVFHIIIIAFIFHLFVQQMQYTNYI